MVVITRIFMFMALFPLATTGKSCTAYQGGRDYSIRLPGDVGGKTENDLVVRELIVRNSLAEYPESGRIHISFGRDRERRFVAPPEGFIDGLSDVERAHDITFLPVPPADSLDGTFLEKSIIGIFEIVSWSGSREAHVRSTYIYDLSRRRTILDTHAIWRDGFWYLKKPEQRGTSNSAGSWQF